MSNLKIVFILFVLAGSNLFSLEFQLKKEELFKAMDDEIHRSMNTLSIESLEKPYYLEYKLEIYKAYSVRSTLGSLAEENETNYAKLNVSIRVGDYSFDNTNFFDIGLSFFGSGDDEERFKNRQLPVELDYNSLRRELWLATDAAYKQASELYSKKKSAMKNRIMRETIPDFIKGNSDSSFSDLVFPDFDLKEWKAITKKISKVFVDFPEIISSSAGVEYAPKIIIYANSEGKKYIKKDFYTGLEVAAYTIASDGMPIYNYFSNFSKDPNYIPILDSLISSTKKIAEELILVNNAKVLEEPYSGPILFENEAAGELWAQCFAPNFILQRSTFTESGTQTIDKNAAFQNKIGGRVLPEFLSVEDNPFKKGIIFSKSQIEANKIIINSQTEYIGAFNLDDDGIKPDTINLVENGYLKTLISERVPSKKIKQSSGRKREGSQIISNLIINSKPENEKSIQELKAQLLEICKKRDLPYGLLVKRVANSNILFTTIYRNSGGILKFPKGEGSIALPVIYKIYQDGSEEIIRGCEGHGFNARSFRDIIAVGKEKYSYNLLANSVIPSFISGGGQYIPVTIESGAILFEDAEVKPIEDDFKKPPIIPSPLTIKNNRN